MLDMNDITDVSIEEKNSIKAAVKKTIKNNLAKLIALLSIVAIALGGLNDTLDALEKIKYIALSQFTDIPSHEKLNKVYIRASSELLDETFGAPVYIKKTHSDDIVKYYKDSNYIISSIEKGGAIAAYLVFPEKGFYPDTHEHSGGEDLLNNTLSHQESAHKVSVNMSRTNTYYIEENLFGEYSNLYSSISGFSSFLSATTNENQKRLATLADAQMFGNDVNQAVVAVRDTLVPNFFGYSTLDMESLESAILSNTEYRLISKL
ncbi:ETEC_3214 domain-containing protein [Vibrio breoganii]|nr:ETEC_3214 domain-containing protein [Vibrio breoganii]